MYLLARIPHLFPLFILQQTPSLLLLLLPSSSSSSSSSMAAAQRHSQSHSRGHGQRSAGEFEDFLPIMAERLGEEGLMQELCNGFRLLMDPRRGLITFESLKRNADLLGLGGLRDDELRDMLREGDVDGDGALSEMEFCVLMVRLSPELMEGPRLWMDEALRQTFFG